MPGSVWGLREAPRSGGAGFEPVLRRAAAESNGLLQVVPEDEEDGATQIPKSEEDRASRTLDDTTLHEIFEQVSILEGSVVQHMRDQQTELNLLKSELRFAMEVFITYTDGEHPTQSATGSAESSTEKPAQAALKVLLVQLREGLKPHLALPQDREATAKSDAMLEQSKALRSGSFLECTVFQEKLAQDLSDLSYNLDLKAAAFEHAITEQIHTALQGIMGTIEPIQQASKKMLTKLEAAEAKRTDDLSLVEAIEERVERLSHRVDLIELRDQDSGRQASTSTGSLAARMDRMEMRAASMEKAEKMTCGMVTLSELRDILDRERLQRKEELPSLRQSIIANQTDSLLSLEKRLQAEQSSLREELSLAHLDALRDLPSSQLHEQFQELSRLSAREKLQTQEQLQTMMICFDEEVASRQQLQLMKGLLEKEIVSRQDLEARLLSSSRSAATSSPSRDPRRSATTGSPSRDPAISLRPLEPMLIQEAANSVQAHVDALVQRAADAIQLQECQPAVPSGAPPISGLREGSRSPSPRATVLRLVSEMQPADRRVEPIQRVSPSGCSAPPIGLSTVPLGRWVHTSALSSPPRSHRSLGASEPPAATYSGPAAAVVTRHSFGQVPSSQPHKFGPPLLTATRSPVPTRRSLRTEFRQESARSCSR